MISRKIIGIMCLAVCITVMTACGGMQSLKTQENRSTEKPLSEMPKSLNESKSASEDQKPNEIDSKHMGYRDKVHTIEEIRLLLAKKYINFEQNYVYEGIDQSGGYCFGSKDKSEEALKNNPSVQVNPYTGNYYDRATHQYLDVVLEGLSKNTDTKEVLLKRLKNEAFMKIKESDYVNIILYNMGDPLVEIVGSSKEGKRIIRVNLTTGDVFDFATDQWYGMLK